YTAIAESEQKYRLMFENSKDAILLAGTDGTILALNSAAYKVFTINGPLIKVINISDLLSTQTDRIKDSSLFYQKSSFSGEINFKRYDESVFTAEVVSSQYKSEPNKWVSVIVVRDITERKLLEEELAKERNLREQLIMQQVIQTQEMEREQIGGELHDNICQILATTKHYLELIERKQEFSQTFLPQARQMINDSILEIRHLSHAMNPPALQSKNITDALKDLAASVKATGKLEVAFYANDNLELLNLQKKRALFRIAQEQLNNVLKHAEATEAIVNIQLFGNEIHLRITDNGKGFDPMQHKAGLGLHNM
ncbi:MAG: PAS domain-containing sensor histidine kinase, partial [Lacibacter sp.]